MATAETVLQLDPAKVLAVSNIRHGLKSYAVQSMADSIAERGRVETPVLVAPLAKGESANGHTHRLLTGYTRHAAVTMLNKQGAGIQLPALVRPLPEPVDLIRLQVTENHERQNFSPMDEAHAAKALLDAGVSQKDVLAIFKRPKGKGKGLVMEPASPAWLRQTLKFLTLPKAIQAAIHEGTVSVKAAYELLRVPEEKREDVLKRAEAKRARDEERDERDSERVERTESKEAEKAEKLVAATAAVEKAQAERTAATEAHNAKTQTLKETRVAMGTRFAELINEVEGIKDAEAKEVAKTKADKEKTLWGERLAAAKKELRDAEKAASSTGIALDKAQRVLKALTEPKPVKVADPEGEAALTAQKAAAKPKTKAITEGQVKAAAKKEGAGRVAPLTLAGVQAFVGELAKSKTAKVKAIAGVLAEVLAGRMDAKAAEKALSK